MTVVHMSNLNIALNVCVNVIGQIKGYSPFLGGVKLSQSIEREFYIKGA